MADWLAGVESTGKSLVSNVRPKSVRCEKGETNDERVDMNCPKSGESLCYCLVERLMNE